MKVGLLTVQNAYRPFPGTDIIPRMSKAEILAELPRLSPEELAEVQAKLDELAGNAWQDQSELSDADKSALDAALAEYEKDPAAGSPWHDVKSRVQDRLRS